MHRDTRPGDALHERHRRTAIDVGVVHLVLLDDAEHAHRRRMPLHARRHRAFGEEAVGIVDPDLLLVDRDRDDQGSLRLGAGFLLGRLHLAVRGLAYTLFSRLGGGGRPGDAWLGILPVIQRGVGVGCGADGPGGR